MPSGPPAPVMTVLAPRDSHEAYEVASVMRVRRSMVARSVLDVQCAEREQSRRYRRTEGHGGPEKYIDERREKAEEE